jgi:hypothetical protein
MDLNPEVTSLVSNLILAQVTGTFCREFHIVNVLALPHDPHWSAFERLGPEVSSSVPLSRPVKFLRKFSLPTSLQVFDILYLLYETSRFHGLFSSGLQKTSLPNSSQQSLLTSQICFFLNGPS